MRSLVVEDEFISRLALQRQLSRFGESHIAVSGEEAVAAFRLALGSASPYELVCMDIRMPGIDGVEALRQIRKLEDEEGVLPSKGVKIFMTTAVDQVKEVVESYRALCDAYLVKPIDGTKLLEKLLELALIP